MIKVVFLTFFFTGCSNFPPKADIKIGSTAEFQVDVSYYAAQAPVQKTILIMPPTGGTNYLDTSYAEALQANGFDVYILNHWTGDNEWNIELGIHQRLYTRAQRAITEVINHVNTPEIGMLGTSVGGLHASVAASNQPRLNSVFVITAGVSIPEVIVTSDQKAMTDAKSQRYLKYGFTNDEVYQKALSKEFLLDPTELQPLYKTKKLGMVIGLKDKTVSTKSQNQLLVLWKPTTVISFNNDHFWSIVKSWLFKESEIIEFFQKTATL